MSGVAAPEPVRRLVLGLDIALILIVVLWQLGTGAGSARFLMAAISAIPALLPLPGLIARTRRTYAWATLCVIPYLMLGTVEAIANPAARAWAAVCLGCAFALFAALIGYLRVTRPMELPDRAVRARTAE
jgi:uncharacterized membrane protein